MKKHLAGFALFCLIVGSAVAVAGLFGYFFSSTKTEICPLTPPEPEIRKCKMDTRPKIVHKNAPLIKQAVFNTRTKQIKIEMRLGENYGMWDTTYVRLNYFRNDSDGPRFIISETFVLSPDSAPSGAEKRERFVISSYSWLDQLDGYENLYVTGEILRENYSLERSPAAFDIESAREITLFHGDWFELDEIKPSENEEVEIIH